MFKIEELKFTKFFATKSPIGIEQKGESLDNYSIGIDIYMPKCTPEFIKAFIEANEKNYENFRVIPDILDNLNILNIYDGQNKLGIIEFGPETETSFEFTNEITIPSGIGLLIPDNVWGMCTSKSSNFCNGYTIVDGKIDMNFTYGFGLQLIPLNNRDCITLKENQKFAQLLFIEACPVLKTTEIDKSDWEKLEDVVNKRTTRIGGMGSEGKF